MEKKENKAVEAVETVETVVETTVSAEEEIKVAEVAAETEQEVEAVEEPTVTEEEVNIYLQKELAIRQKYNSKIDKIQEEINALRAKKQAEIKQLRKDFPLEFIKGEKITPRIYWVGKLVNGRIGHECLRIFLTKEEEVTTTKKKVVDGETVTTTNTKSVFMYKEYVNIFTQFQQGRDGRIFATDEDIMAHPVWIRANHSDGDFIPFNKENGGIFAKNGTAITADLFATLCRIVESAKNVQELRENLIQCLHEHGMVIAIDKVAFIDSKKFDDPAEEESVKEVSVDLESAEKVIEETATEEQN